MPATLAPDRPRRRRPGSGLRATQICVRPGRFREDDGSPRRAYRRRVPPAAPPAGRWGWRDLVPALPLLAIGLAGTGRAAAQQPEWVRPLDGWAYALVVVAAGGLLLRRRAPPAAAGVCGLATAGYLAATHAYGPILLCVPAAAWAGG